MFIKNIFRKLLSQGPITISLAVVLSVFLVTGMVNAATTISTNIATGGTLSVTGLSSLGQASSTMFSANTAYFGQTATSSFSSSGGLTTVKVTINNDPSTAGALKIHSHNMANGVEYSSEFKGEFLGTSGTMDGIASHYHMAASGTGVMRSILGVAYLDTGITLSGTSASASWISGILGSVNVAGTVNGTAVTVTGVYGGLGSMTGGTLTQVNDMSAIWADSQVTQVPTTGDSQLLLMTNGAGATLNQAIKIDASDRITNFIRFDNADGSAAGDMLSAPGVAATSTDPAGDVVKIRILIGDTPYYINAYSVSNN
jgi:hypothetical protein